MNTLMIPRQSKPLESHHPLPFGMTHPNDTPCPFAGIELSHGYINTCCSFSTAVAAKNLARFRRPALAHLLQMSLDADSVPDLVRELQLASEELELQYVEPQDEHTPSESGLVDAVTKEFIPVAGSAFESALASIHMAIYWYQTVGGLGFGVEAWY